MRKIKELIGFWLVVFFLTLPWGRCEAKENSLAETPEVQPSASADVKGFTFVLPGKKGEKECVIQGDTAHFKEADVIEISEVKAQVFREGASDIFITSKKGEFNRTTREVNTLEHVRIDSSEMQIEGDGLLWLPASNKAWIHRNVTVKIMAKPKGIN